MLEIQNLTIAKKQVRQNSVLLENVNLKFSNNHFYSLFGENGAGKSTLLKVILGIYDKDAFHVDGSILFSNMDLLTSPTEEVNKVKRNYIKYVPQSASSSFDPLKKLKYYFELFNLNKDEFAEHLDDLEMQNFDNILDLHPYEISGGMAQRLLIIMAVMQKPKVLLLDEPTSALDTPVLNLLKIYLKKFIIKHGSTVICVSHDKDFLDSTSDIQLVIRDKKIKEEK